MTRSSTRARRVRSWFVSRSRAAGGYPTASGGDSHQDHEHHDGIASGNLRGATSDEGRTETLEAAFSQSKRVVGVTAWSPHGLRLVEFFSSARTFRGVTDRVLEGARERLNTVTQGTPGSAVAAPWRGYSVDAVFDALRRTAVFEAVPNGLAFSGKGFRGYLSLSPAGELFHFRCEFD